MVNQLVAGIATAPEDEIGVRRLRTITEHVSVRGQPREPDKLVRIRGNDFANWGNWSGAGSIIGTEGGRARTAFFPK